MIGAGTFISPLIKVVTSVAILAAVYFFIVKPVLETTERTIDRSFESLEVFDDLQPNVRDSIRDAEALADHQQAASDARIREANKLLDCITAAGADTAQIERCNRRFDPSNP